LIIAQQAHYVLLQSNDGVSIFRRREDYEVMLSQLREQSVREGVLIHGFALLSSEVHLLVTPKSEEALSKMMQGLGRNYVRYFNNLYDRFGTLWAGRYKSSVVQPGEWIKRILIYFDHLPVLRSDRNELTASVATPEDYEWTSHGHFTGQNIMSVITAHADIWGLGNTPFAREEKYTLLSKAGIGRDLCDYIASTVRGGWVLGDVAFIGHIQTLTHRRVAKAKAGRPALNRLTPSRNT
jgi:putative transposase